MTRTVHRKLLMICLAVAAVFPAVPACRHEAQEAPPPQALEVKVVKPLVRPVVDSVQYTARLEAVETVDVRARVSGYLVKIDFEAGAEVPAGKLLFLIDPRPYKASLDAAVAHVAVGKARLKQLDSELARSKRLLPSGAISQEDFEKTVAQQAETVAGIEAAKADEEKAKLNVEFTEVKAEIAGIVSRELITLGNLVTADQTLLTNIVKPDPIYAYFNVDEITVQRLLKAANRGDVKSDEHGDSVVYFRLGSETGFPHKGRVDFVDNKLDPSTGTIQVRAVLPNPRPTRGKRSLVPGFFGRVKIPVTEPYQATLVPERALMADQGRKFVLVADEHDLVQRRDVEVGKLEDGYRVILRGLGGDDRVLVEGLQLVRRGMTVKSILVEASAVVGPAKAPGAAKSAPEAAKPPAKAAKPAAGKG
jgi:RND family efflux transporter MFP subunit